MKMTPAQVSVALASALGQMENAILKSGGADTTGLMTAWSAVKEQLRAPLDALADVLENLRLFAEGWPVVDAVDRTRGY